MKWVKRQLLTFLGLFIALVSVPAVAQPQSRQGILKAIPGDALSFAVVHNLADVSQSVSDVAKLVQAPAPDLLSLAKQMSGITKGLDEQGDLAIVLTSVDPKPKGVTLIPIANFAEFFGALQAEEPTTDIVEVQVAHGPKLVGRKGDYAAIALTTDRDALEQFLAETSNLSADASLAEWLDANKASVVVTSHGIKRLLPKLTSGIHEMQAKFRRLPGDQGQTAADSFDMYVHLLTAVEPEIDQFGLGLRIDSDRTVDLVKRVQFTPEGTWAKWAADVKPATDDLLTGLPAGPFVVAIGGILPPGAMEHLMKYSVQIMQKQPMYKLTPKQAETYAELSLRAMSGLRAMQMVVGVAAPGTGFYGNTTAVMKVDDSKSFLAGYEKSLTAMREFAQEVKSPGIPVATSRRLKVGETEGLEVSMDLSKITQFTPPGGPDPQKMMQLMFGANGTMTLYLAPADEHTMVTSYTSPEQLKSAIDFYNSKQPGLSADAEVAEVAAALPAGSQLVAYFSLNGVANFLRQFASTMVPAAPAAAIPEFSLSPPLGIAAKIAPSGAEGHLIVTAETLRAIGDVVAEARGSALRADMPQQ